MATKKTEKRIPVLKTYKVYINGQFPRTESGRYYAVQNAKGLHIANICLCSRKDLRDAISAARAAWTGWSGRPAFNRGQILYRMAEMLEGRKAQFIEELTQMGLSPAKAQQEVWQSIDRLVYYSGWCDKYQALFGTVNPVASSHFNFSMPESMGVVGIVAPESSPLLGLISCIAPVIAGGNTTVVWASEKWPLSAITLAEALHSSDLPAGVLNILTGSVKEMLPWMAGHMDMNAILYAGTEDEQLRNIRSQGAVNIKRVKDYGHVNWSQETAASPYSILDFQEIKTTWHPVEPIGAGKAGY